MLNKTDSTGAPSKSTGSAESTMTTYSEKQAETGFEATEEKQITVESVSVTGHSVTPLVTPEEQKSPSDEVGDSFSKVVSKNIRVAKKAADQEYELKRKEAGDAAGDQEEKIPAFKSVQEQVEYDETTARKMIEKSGLAKQHELIDEGIRRLQRQEQEEHKNDHYRDYHATLIADRKDPKGLYQSYEHQPKGSNNCYCCAAAALYNQHMLHKRKKALAAKQPDPGIGEQLTQYDVRVFRPEFRSFQDYGRNMPKLTRAHYDDYLREIDLVSSYTSKDSHEMGNIYALSDMFVQLDPQVCTNCMTFYRSCLMNESGIGINPVAQRLMENHFLDQISSILATGEAVAILSEGHYRTIVGINGHNLQILDSVPTEDKKFKEISVNDLFNTDEGLIEITWLSEKNDKLQTQFSDLYVEGDELKSKSKISENDIGHTLGVDVTHTYEEKRSIPVTIRSSVSHVMYVPKNDAIQKTTVADMRAGGEHEAAKQASKNIVSESNLVQDTYQSAFDEAYKELRTGANAKNASLDGAFLKRFETRFRTEYAKKNKIDPKDLKEAVFPITLRRTVDVDREYLNAVKGCEKAEELPDPSDISKEDVEEFVKNAIECGMDPVGYKKKKEDKRKAEEAAKKKEEKSEYGDMETPGAEDTDTKSVSAVIVPDVTVVKAVTTEPSLKAKDINYENGNSYSFEALAKTFLDTDEKGRSKEFIELKRALSESAQLVAGFKTLKFTFSEENYKQFLRIYNAASAYVTAHSNDWSKATKNRVRDAGRIMEHLNFVALGTLKSNDEKIPEETKLGYSLEEYGYAWENVNRLVDYYKKYSKQIDSDPLATDEEKLRRKWECLKCSERDIRIYLKVMKFNAVHSPAQFEEDTYKYLTLEYNSLKTQIMLRDFAKKSGFRQIFTNETDDALMEAGNTGVKKVLKTRERDSSLNYDDGLTKKQIGALSQIDTWIVRNFRNGGYLGFKGHGVVSDRTDIASRLFSMSRRQRMYIYYLIETRERVNPTYQGFVDSQTDYVPDIDEFKHKMVANRLKFYKRFSGGYIYWEKINQAIDIAEGASTMIDAFDEAFEGDLLKDANKKQDDKKNDDAKKVETKTEEAKTEEAKKDDSNVSAVDKHIASLKELLPTIMMIVALERRNAKKIPKKERERNEQTIESLKKAVNSKQSDIDQITDWLAGYKAEKTGHRAQVKQYLVTMPGDVSKIGTLLGKGLSDPKIVTGLGSNASYDLGIDLNVMSGVGTYLSLAGIISNIISLYEGRKTMSYLDITANIADSVTKGAAICSSVAGLCGAAGVATKGVEILTATPVGLIVGGMEAGVAIVKYCSLLRDTNHREAAEKLAKKKKHPDKYLDGMMKLSRRLDSRQATSAGSSAAIATLTLTASFIIAGAALTCGVGAIVGVAAFAATLALKSYDKKKAIEMKNELFDSYYDLPKLCVKAEADWKKRNPGQELTDKVKEDIKLHLRRRLASHLGFSSPLHAAKFIANDYAREIRARAIRGDEDSQLYIELIQGLGLRYKYDSANPDKTTPTDSDIAKKLCK